MDNILIFTGAGLSAESGISTFRDNEDGLWTRYNPAIVANLFSFHENQELVFKFYNERRTSLTQLSPNRAHFGLALLQKMYGKDRVKIYTQNIDDLLEKAGCEDVIHVHGKLTDMNCLKCDSRWKVGYAEFKVDTPCPFCKSAGVVKPGVVFFNENAPEYPDMYKTFRESRNDIIIVIGTSGEVVPLGKIAANRRSPSRSFCILNNKEYDKFGNVPYHLFDVHLFKPATEAIDRIVEIVGEKLK